MRSGWISILLFFFCIIGFCQVPAFTKIEIDTNYSFRGLSVVDDSVAWVSGIRGVVGMSRNGGISWSFIKVKGFEKADFRTLYAFNSSEAIIANAGSPAYILRTSDGGITWNTVYTNKDSLAFFDGIDFWNDREGIIYADPIKGRMLLLRTADGGKSWQELPERSRPELSEGEASFAASGTGIRCYGKEKVVIATGGMVSRLLASSDKGNNWYEIKTPILQGQSSTGIFSFAFAGDQVGVIVGGDYRQDTLRKDNVFYTNDGGLSWKKPEVTTNGYRECVEFVSENIVITVGPGGADFLNVNTYGNKWQPIPGQKGYHVVRKARKGKLVIAAGSKKISVVKTVIEPG